MEARILGYPQFNDLCLSAVERNQASAGSPTSTL